MKKYIVFICDGCADLPLEELGGKTPLEAAHLAHIDALAKAGVVGRAKTVPDGIPPGSDTAILSIFGYDPREHYTGRSPLEAAGSGVALPPGGMSFRVNLAGVEETAGGTLMRSHSGGNISGEEALALMGDLLRDGAFQGELAKIGMSIQVQPSFRHIGVLAAALGDMTTAPPHEIVGEDIARHLPGGAGEALRPMMLRSYEVLRDHPLNRKRLAEGKLAANMLWPWGEGRAIALPSFEEKYGIRAAAVSAVPLVWGIARLAGCAVRKVPTATGDLHTDYEAKADAALSALREGFDCVFLHVEAPDECSHDGDTEGKMEAMRRIDTRLLPRLLDGVRKEGRDFRLLLLSDHYTLLSTRGHDATPVPFLLYDSAKDTGGGLPFDETSAEQGPLIDPATGLMQMLLAPGGGAR